MNRLNHLCRFCLTLFACILLSACAVSPYSKDIKARSDALLAQQMEQAKAGMAQDAAPRLLFAGVAMNDQTTAFRNDVLLAETVVRSVDPKAIVFKLVNPVPGQDADVPYATRENIAAVLQKLSELARPQDKVMVLLASHGAEGFLSLHAGKEPLGFATVADVARWLQPLGTKPTLLVISACHSGSFIDPLRRPNRIILTAAAKDRSSFGCQPKSDNTFFTKALLGQPALLSLSTREMMRLATLGVSELETKMKLTPPSLPQYFYGPGVQDWSNQAVGRWLDAK
jgi:Peptidase C13 family